MITEEEEDTMQMKNNLDKELSTRFVHDKCRIHKRTNEQAKKANTILRSLAMSLKSKTDHSTEKIRVKCILNSLSTIIYLAFSYVKRNNKEEENTLLNEKKTANEMALRHLICTLEVSKGKQGIRRAGSWYRIRYAG